MCGLLVLLVVSRATAQSSVPLTSDTTKLPFPFKDSPALELVKKPAFFLKDPANIRRTVTFDPTRKQYLIQDKIGDRLYRPPQFMTIDQYRRYQDEQTKRAYWNSISDSSLSTARTPGFIPPIQVKSRTFERIFGGSTIDIRPQGNADVTLSGRINRNENPLFNERQRKQTSFDFDQHIQMNVLGMIGEKLKVGINYNTEAMFDFDNQMKFDYTGGADEIIQKIEAGNVSFSPPTRLINGGQALFGIKTKMKFGRAELTTVLSQQKSQAKEITIANGAQQSDFRLSADSYDANRHFFLAQYFRNNYNRALANLPVITSNVNITRVEVWITNRSNSTTDSRDLLAFIDLGENRPYNTVQVSGAGGSVIPAGFAGPGFTRQSSNLLQNLPPGARLTNSNEINTYFQANGGTDNYVRLTYAQKLTDREFKLNEKLGYISLNRALNADEVLAVAYRYTVGGEEFQVGEFSADIPVDPVNPKLLFVKLLKNETLKTNLPTWDLMMKNIYSLPASQISSSNFKLNVLRLDDNSGIERPSLTEGQNTNGQLWLQVLGLDHLNQQNDRSPDGYFDFLDGVTIDALNARITFPKVEPFGSDLRSQFIPGTEQALIDKYVFQALYDSTKAVAQQQYPRLNRYVLSGSYQSAVSNRIELSAINVPAGSVQVFAGTLPLVEGADYTVDYNMGSVTILNQAMLNSGQKITVRLENSEAFGLQQRSLAGTRLDYKVNKNLLLGGTFLNLTEKPLTAKVNFGEEAISNTMLGFDLNYQSPSRWLTRMVDKLPFLTTKEPSSLSFSGEFARLLPGHPKSLDFAGSSNGASYLDDFEATRSIFDIKAPISWQISGTPQLFPESQLRNDLAYGYNRARLAFYTIDPIFFRNTSLTPSNIKGDRAELSNPYVREVLEQEVFPNKQSTTGQPLTLPTFDLAFYPAIRGPYNYGTSGLNANGTFNHPRSKWGGITRKLETTNFEEYNIEYIEMWFMDPFINKPTSQGGDLYFNLGSVSEDILADGRKSLENGLSPDGNAEATDATNWGRVPKLQPVVQAFDNDPAARKFQDVGIDGIGDTEERQFFATFLTQVRSQLSAAAVAKLEADPSSDNYQYYRGDNLDQASTGILGRYERYNGTEGNSKTTEQSRAETGIDNTASTSLPDGEDLNRDNNSSLADEYFGYKVSMRPHDLVVGQNYITDKQTTTVKLPNGSSQPITWYQMRIPVAQYTEKVGNIQDFKSIRFVRMFLTDFADTVILRMAKLQLLRGDWRRYNSENSVVKVLADPALGLNPGLDRSQFDVSTINIEENGNRTPIPYVVPPGIERERDFSNFRGDTRQNEQSLLVNVENLRDGYARAAFKTGNSDFRSYRKLELFVHAEGAALQDNEVRAFIRVGTDNQDNYYEYEVPLKVTMPPASDPYSVWPEANRMSIELALLQQAKVARNAALRNGQPWPVNLPFRVTDGNNSITVMGQPDLSKVRVFMLGVRNPLRNAGNPGSDDGLEKSAQVWFNELRLTDFDERGGWASSARVNAKLADFADVAVSGSKSTIGFGSIDKRVSERNRSDDRYFDLSSAMEFGKFFPQRTGISIPVYINFSSQLSMPQYDPRTPDIELKNVLKTISGAAADSIRQNVMDYTSRRSINFTNVRKVNLNPDARKHLWDVENLSATYSYNEYYHHDFINSLNSQKTYRAELDYLYANQPRNYKPFQKVIKSQKLALLRDFNFSLLPTTLRFRVNLDRSYAENTIRDNVPNTYVPVNTTFNKNFLLTRQYGLSWDLTKSIKIDLNATNLSVIDEPNGRIGERGRDSIWRNLKRLGRTSDYNHVIGINYLTPISKIPGLQWTALNIRYSTNFFWKTEPLVTLRDPSIDFGNTIENRREIELRPSLNFAALYNKWGFVRRALNGETSGTFGSALIRGLTSVKSITGSYQKNQGTYVPGYQPGTNLLGYDFDENAPGWGFLFGSQADIRGRAIRNGWMTRDSLLNQLYVTTTSERIDLRGRVEPLRDMIIDLTLARNRNFNYSTNFRFDPASNGFRNLSPVTTGDYSVSFLSLKTAFGHSGADLFQQFEANRRVISARLGGSNPNSSGTSDGFADGYTKNSQDVLVSAFLAAYTGKDAGSSSLNTFPKIPIPNWRVTYTGLTRYELFNRIFSMVRLSHEYRSSYAVSSFNSLIRYQEINGFSAVRDVNANFLPKYQFGLVRLAEDFLPLLGADVTLKNSMTLKFEYSKSRLMSLSLANTQLAQEQKNTMTFGLGYHSSGFRLPFDLFSNFKLKNDLTFRLDMGLRDNRVMIFRPDVADAEVSSGAKNITYSPSIDYVLNQRFNVRIFYDGNITKPYTSQTFNTSFSNFGVNMRFSIQ